MIRIEKMECDNILFANNMTHTQFRRDMDFYDLTDMTLTKADFEAKFQDVISQFGRVRYVEDAGDYIVVQFHRENNGTLVIRPEPPPVPEKKRPTKNLEALVSFANSKGLHVAVDQTVSLTWQCYLHRQDSEIAGKNNWPFSATAYAAVKQALVNAGLLPGTPDADT
jgi:hypothetical protein